MHSEDAGIQGEESIVHFDVTAILGVSVNTYNIKLYQEEYKSTS